MLHLISLTQTRVHVYMHVYDV